MGFRRRAAWIALSAALIVPACEEQQELTPSEQAFAVAPEIVTGISVYGPERRLDAARGDTRYPFTFRYADGQGRAEHTCRESRRLRAALSRLMSIPVIKGVRAAEAERALAGVPARDWVAVQVRDTIQNVEPLELRILPLAAQRTQVYARLPSGPYFITDSNLLEVLSLGCE